MVKIKLRDDKMEERKRKMKTELDMPMSRGREMRHCKAKGRRGLGSRIISSL